MSLFAHIGQRSLPTDHPDYEEIKALQHDLITAVGGDEAFHDRLRSFFRSAIDEVIDTARTGRFFLSDLEKTEKTYLGTKFEILLRDWLQVPHGVILDLQIGGREVDVKSTTGGGWGWMIPPEALNHLCILLRVNEIASTCAFGLVRARPDYLNPGKNRDAKSTFSASGRHNIWWLAQDYSYTPNFWTMISEQVRERIMGHGGGARRIAELFESCLETPVSRTLIASIAAQDDFMKRIRRKGGARDFLAPKGIAILYSETDRDVIKALGIRVGYREFVSYQPQSQFEVGLLRSAGHID